MNELEFKINVSGADSIGAAMRTAQGALRETADRAVAESNRAKDAVERIFGTSRVAPTAASVAPLIPRVAPVVPRPAPIAPPPPSPTVGTFDTGGRTAEFGFRQQNRVSNALVSVVGLDSPLGRVANTVEYLGHMSDRTGMSITKMLGALAPSVAAAAGLGLIAQKVREISDETDQLNRNLGREEKGVFGNLLDGYRELFSGRQGSRIVGMMTLGLGTGAVGRFLGLDKGERSEGFNETELEALRAKNFAESSKRVIAEIMRKDTPADKLEAWFNSVEVRARKVSADKLKDEAREKLREIEKEEFRVNIAAAVTLAEKGGTRDEAAIEAARRNREIEREIEMLPGRQSGGPFDARREADLRESIIDTPEEMDVLRNEQRRRREDLTSVITENEEKSPVEIFNEWLEAELKEGKVPTKEEARDKFRQATFEQETRDFFERGAQNELESRFADRRAEVGGKLDEAQDRLTRLQRVSEEGTPLTEMAGAFTVESYRNRAQAVQSAEDKNSAPLQELLRQAQEQVRLLTRIAQGVEQGELNPLEKY